MKSEKEIKKAFFIVEQHDSVLHPSMKMILEWILDLKSSKNTAYFLDILESVNVENRTELKNLNDITSFIRVLKFGGKYYSEILKSLRTIERLGKNHTQYKFENMSEGTLSKMLSRANKKEAKNKLG